MEIYKSERGIGALYLLLILLIGDGFAIFLMKFLDSYVVLNLLWFFIICFTFYCFYYLIMDLTLEYRVYKDKIEINTIMPFRKVKINLNEVLGYRKEKGDIKGTKLSGIGTSKFAFGKGLIENIGVTYMYVPSSKGVIYIRTKDKGYGLSPKDIDKFEKMLIDNGIEFKNFEMVENKNIHLHKEKKFIIPFMISAIIIIFMTINPFVFYLMDKLPAMMPVNFNANFEAIAFTTGKMFAFRQMTYGVFNMIILLCMYYASRFCAKYDKESMHKYVYISLALALVFLFMQIKILVTFL